MSLEYHIDIHNNTIAYINARQKRTFTGVSGLVSFFLFFLEGDYFALQIVYSVSRNMIFKYKYKKESVSNLCLNLSW